MYLKTLRNGAFITECASAGWMQEVIAEGAGNYRDQIKVRLKVGLSEVHVPRGRSAKARWRARWESRARHARRKTWRSEAWWGSLHGGP